MMMMVNQLFRKRMYKTSTQCITLAERAEEDLSSVAEIDSVSESSIGAATDARRVPATKVTKVTPVPGVSLKMRQMITDIDSDQEDPLMCSLYAPDIYIKSRVSEVLKFPMQIGFSAYLKTLFQLYGNFTKRHKSNHAGHFNQLAGGGSTKRFVSKSSASSQIIHTQATRYVHNNIFFSFAVDADLGQLSKSSSVKLKSVNIISLSDSSEKACCNHGGCSDSHVEKTNGSNLEEDACTDSQLADSEQATYASANNDLKGTKAYQEAHVPGLYNLAMAIIDYRGHRVVAQVLEAAKRLHLKEHTVLDAPGNAVKLAAAVECKGIVGSDDRQYLLDLMRVTPRDSNYIGPGTRFCVLRPELAEDAERSQVSSVPDGEVPVTDAVSRINDSKEGVEAVDTDYNSEILSATDRTEETEVKAAQEIKIEKAENGVISEEELAADEENVRKAGSYLKDVVLPKFVQDLCTLEVSPMDGGRIPWTLAPLKKAEKDVSGSKVENLLEYGSSGWFIGTVETDKYSLELVEVHA
ncbi:hypothetical protein C5167_023306 [Papaver somniferum]|uniref:Clu domain-containing protein n=1 Tax=Papaver somniferum TaxID=3469 RepID=A0A4Y7JKE7_PAPSO|nr:hypothetical protein C5167_023306 [Papaver somniferum]